MPGVSYDFIVVGGGHNGLIAAATLRIAGGSVLVVGAPGLGGLAGASERGSIGPAYSVGLMPKPLAKVLGIDTSRWIYTTDPSWLVVEDGEVVFRWWSSKDRLLREFEAHGLREGGERLLSLLESWRTCGAPLLLYNTNPPSLDEAAALVSERCGEELGEAIAGRASDTILAGLGWLEGLLTYPALAGEPGYATLYFNSSMGVWGLPKNPSKGVSYAIAEAARRLGVDIVEGRGKIVVKGGRAVSVRLSDGSMIEARKAIVYSGNIACLRDSVEGEGAWRGEVEEASKRALRASLEFQGPTRFNLELSRQPGSLVNSGPSPILELWGRGYWGEVLYLPDSRIAFTGFLEGPGSLKNFLEDLGVDPEWVRGLEDLGPLWQEALHCNPGGNPNHLPMTGEYILSRRPLEGWADYSTSVDGLYHASASSHPGGQITGLPGFNAARRILEDLGLEAPSAVEEVVRKPFRGVAEA